MEKKEAIEKQIAGKWHIITQEAIEYVDHVLFNKDTFFRDGKVKSICLHNTRRELPDEVNKGTQAGFYSACYHVPLFVDILSAAKNMYSPVIAR